MVAERCRRRFTADEYQRMGEVGILSENDRVELIEGDVVVKMTIGSRHNACVDRTTRAMVIGAGDDAIVRVQGSFRLDLFSEPEPDLVLLRPQTDFYATRLPGPADVLLVVEIADTSRDYDRDVKARIYAEGGIREYWLADLVDNVLVCYADPEGGGYHTIRRYRRGQSVAPQLLASCVIPADVLLAD
jgi:Uma2 family endonuclease